VNNNAGLCSGLQSISNSVMLRSGTGFSQPQQPDQTRNCKRTTAL
jgi:hypothetical protein